MNDETNMADNHIENNAGSAKPPKVKKSKTLNDCWCGCGGKTAGRFMPGHDAKFHSDAKKVARGQISDDELPPMPHAAAAEEFQKCVDAERVLWAEKMQRKDEEKRRKEAERAAKQVKKLEEATRKAEEQITKAKELAEESPEVT